MSLIVRTTNAFEKDLKKSKKRGKNFDKLKKVLSLLEAQEELPAKNRNHKLSGNWKGHSECHIEPDWLLIYRTTETDLILVRTGTHSDFF